MILLLSWWLFTLCKKCLYSELFWSAFFPYFTAFELNTDILHISPYLVQMRKNAAKMRTRITPNTDIFYKVSLLQDFHLIFIISPSIKTERNRLGHQRITQVNYSSMKIQELTSNVVITLKNEKLCQTTGIQGTQGQCSDKVTSEWCWWFLWLTSS